MESRKRTILKTLSWRVVATVVTTLIAWRVTGSGTFGISIGLLDTTIKLAAYYVHERAWSKVRLGYHPPAA